MHRFCPWRKVVQHVNLHLCLTVGVKPGSLISCMDCYRVMVLTSQPWYDKWVCMCVFSFPLSDDGIARPGAPPSAFIHTWLDRSDLDSMRSSMLAATRAFCLALTDTFPALIASQFHWDDIRTDTLVEVRTAESLLLSTSLVIWRSCMSLTHLNHIITLYVEAHADLFSPVTAKWRTYLYCILGQQITKYRFVIADTGIRNECVTIMDRVYHL